MRVLCGPEVALADRDDADRRVVLYARSLGYASAGSNIQKAVRGLGATPPSMAWDFLSFALAVVAADESCRRDQSPDGWTREIDLEVAVIDPTPWVGQAGALGKTLGFLTGDVWRFSFTDGGEPIPTVKRRKEQPESVVCLLSGGLDSFVGALDLAADGKRPLLVSQIAKGDKVTQRRFASLVPGPVRHLQLNHNVTPLGASERSQRSRSLIFIAFGILGATCLRAYADGATVPLYLPENGLISLNVPLTPLRLGSLSTRTTHPFFIGSLQEIIGTLDIRVTLTNPYQFRTKGEMLVGCKAQDILKAEAHNSTSCGRFARTAFQHCGRCVPCLVRRSSFHQWRIPDHTGYRYDDLSIPDERHRDFDDVKSVGMAIEQVRRHGIRRWAGAALSSTIVADVPASAAVAERGLAELEAFLKVQKVL